LKCLRRLCVQPLFFIRDDPGHFLLSHHDSEPALAVRHHSVLPFVGGACEVGQVYRNRMPVLCRSWLRDEPMTLLAVSVTEWTFLKPWGVLCALQTLSGGI